ncbi:uncharacterized protein SEPMUDRAFT_53674, partial [Sphaerulina musiva SO2202]
KATSYELRRAILGILVINLSRQLGKFVVSNKILELYNSEYSTIFARLTNSTSDIEKTIKRTILNREYTKRITQTLRPLVPEGTTYYTSKKTVVDILSYVYKLVTEGLTIRYKSKGAISDNIYSIGIARLV